jgi:hypothetical protein
MGRIKKSMESILEHHEQSQKIISKKHFSSLPPEVSFLQASHLFVALPVCLKSHDLTARSIAWVEYVRCNFAVLGMFSNAMTWRTR